jgi:hypothetical protein
MSDALDLGRRQAANGPAEEQIEDLDLGMGKRRGGQGSVYKALYP